MDVLKRTFRGATCRVGPAPGSKHGVLEVRTFGPLYDETYVYFREFVLAAISGAPAVVVRLDTVLDAMTAPPRIDDQIYTAENSPPQAVVLRVGSRMDLWQEHADEMGTRGVVRALFLPHEADMAYRFAEVAAAHRVNGPKLSRRVGSDPARL